MSSMPLHPSLADLALRLVLTLTAGIVIGVNRGERGHAAGLRTTTLVCLAAAISMIQMNLLLPVGGKTADDFGVMDMMRLPLGILSGMGFIGAGAILRKGDIVSGVTTAATLWVVTVIGLCFGGGQIWLGIVATALVWIILYVMKHFDLMIAREQKALLTIDLTAGSEIETVLGAILESADICGQFVSGQYGCNLDHDRVIYEIRWKARSGAPEPRGVVNSLLAISGVHRVEWTGTA